MTLTDHIKELNKATRKWAAAEPGRFAGELVEEVDHWHEYGVYTPSQLDRYLDDAAAHNCRKDDW